MVVMGLVVAACGAGPGTAGTTTDNPGTTMAPDPVTTIRSELVPGSTAACASTDPWESVETAFKGTISSVETRPNPDRVGLFEELDKLAPSEGWPWVTFEVSAWFTQDLGTTFSMWAPGFTGAPGEEWLVAGSLYGVSFAGQSGEVFPCVSEAAGPEAEGEWIERHGEPVVAGAGTPEQPGDPEIMAQIEGQRAIWEAAGIDDYTVVVNVYDASVEMFDSSCAVGASTRIVVRAGQPVQAIDLRRFCEVDDMGGLPMVEDLFDLAIANAGALQEPINFDPVLGYIRYFYANDRSTDIGATIEMLEPRPIPAVNGSEPALAEGAEALARWDAAGIRDYSFDVDVICFCTISGRFHVVVKDGTPAEVTMEDGNAVDIEHFDFFEFTIPGVFALIEEWNGGASPDDVVAAFDPELGYPVDIRIDAISEAVDDEVTVVISNFAEMS